MPKQLYERVPRVQMPLVMLQIFMGKQDLRDREIKRAKELLVSGHQPRLANRSAGLQFRKVTRPLRMAEDPHAGTDRSRRNEHDLPPRLPLPRNLTNQLLHLREIGLLAAVGEDAGS